MTDFFKSEQVQDNLRDIFSTYQNLASMTAKIQFEPKETRIEHIDKCQDLIEKQKTFFTRLCLSAPDDDEAADMKERVNLMSQAFGFSNLYECLDKLTETLDAARKKELDT
tara:strand:- start:1935 stop:2267 length:333 start_codon:yes stop_codon:yes gene_type:complete